MKKVTLKRMGCLLLVGLSMFLLFYMIRHTLNNKPEPIKISLENFKGRVYSSEDVKPGTFTLNENFNKALDWNKNAILSYHSMKGGYSARIEIWKPDELTANTFQYAKMRFSTCT